MNWPSRGLDGWHLATHPAWPLPVQPVRARGSVEVGWLIGYPIHPRTGLLRCGLTLDVDPTAARFAQAFERALYALGGRYAAVLIAGELRRLYLDPCGSLPAVFAREPGMAASTGSMIPAGRGTPGIRHAGPHAEVVEALDVPRRDHWYPFGLTPRADVERLLPGHYLDLDAWTRRRHWPSRPTRRVAASDVPETIDGITERTARIVGALVREGAVSCTLTAGRDSRMLLACARPHVERLTFTTPRHPDRAGRMDFRIAGRLAERHGLRHEVVRWSDASSGELQLWQFRTGAAVAGRTWEAVRTEERKWAGTYHVTGHGGEIGRAFYWREEARPTERAAGRIDPAEILRRLHLPRRALLMERCRVCLEGLAGHDLATILDLLYLEQRVGCWATIQFYGHVGPTTHVMAFAHRDTVEDFLRIPPALRRRDGLATTTISRAWPELLELPLNRFLGFEGRMDRALAPARRFLNDHPRIAGALRPGPRT